MSKVALVVPTGSNAYTVPSLTSSGQGVTKSKTVVNLISAFYPTHPTYTVNSDMKIVGLWTNFMGGNGYSREGIATGNSFTFNAGSTTQMTCYFVLNMDYFGSTINFNVTATLNLTTKELYLDYTKTYPHLFEIVGFDIAGYVNT